MNSAINTPQENEASVEPIPELDLPLYSRAALLNARDLENELAWFSQLIDRRFQLYFSQGNSEEDLYAVIQGGNDNNEITPYDELASIHGYLEPPLLEVSDALKSPYAAFVEKHQLDSDERAALVLALIPHIRPQLLDIFFTRNKTFDRRFTEFGGIQSAEQSSFIPTLETLIFILVGEDLSLRFQLIEKLTRDSVLVEEECLKLSSGKNESILKAPLRLADDLQQHLTQGSTSGPQYGQDFPAQKIETQLEWDDLVLHPGTKKQIDDIHIWLKHSETIMQEWGMAKKLRPGYRCLFYGPSGTGKTMTACLLGKSTAREVYRVDLSMVVSKYIGETEKNLAKIFDRAQRKNWILFFDEADAIFGKRTETQSSNDRHANQEVSFLLQRIEVFDGIVILASNFKDNLDEAFTRRFESMIYFPMPRPEERLELWRKAIPLKIVLDEAIDLEKISKEYELTGSMITNVVYRCLIYLLDNRKDFISQMSLVKAIHKELAKAGRIF